MKLSIAQNRMVERLRSANRMMNVHRMGKGYTMATALSLEKLGLVTVENFNMDNGGHNPPFWGVELIETRDLKDAIKLGDKKTLEAAFGCDFPHLED